jgi:hypothetical protein
LFPNQLSKISCSHPIAAFSNSIAVQPQSALEPLIQQNANAEGDGVNHPTESRQLLASAQDVVGSVAIPTLIKPIASSTGATTAPFIEN